MTYTKNLFLSEFIAEITALFSDEFGLDEYFECVRATLYEARKHFFPGLKANQMDDEWAEWMADAKSGFDIKKEQILGFRETRIKSIKPKKEGGGDEIHAFAAHYRLHMYHRPVDLEFAFKIDRAVCGKTLSELDLTVFTYKPDSYYDPPPMEAPMSHPRYISAKRAKELIAEGEDDSVWLNPHNHFSLPLENRDAEKERLTRFLETGGVFRCLPVIAPSGAGKTRLISEWMKDYSAVANPDTKWEAGFLVSGQTENARSPEPWKAWKIKKPTLIVIDYTYAFDDVVRTIVERSISQPEGPRFNIRLIVVDHIWPKILSDDFFWRKLGGDHSSTIDHFRGQYLEKALILESQQDNSVMLRKIVATSAGVGGREVSETDKSVSDAITHLDRIGRSMGDRDSIRHPLFAALMGRALRGDPKTDFSTWNRRDLVTQYFENKDRLPWSGEDDGSERLIKGLNAGALVSAATLRRGIKKFEAKAHLPRDSKTIFQIAQRVVSSDDRLTIGPFLPDILGETFVLIFLGSCLAERVFSEVS